MSQASIWAIPALHDNYIWVAQRDSSIVIVDPGDANVVLDAIQAKGLKLCAILITHHHWDHVNGLEGILSVHDVPVYGPAVDLDRVPGIQHGLNDGDHISLPEIDLDLAIMTIPGHTLDHIAYFGEFGTKPLVFCGDTLFSGGCGRLFEGDPPTMHASLQRLAKLPAETMVCCAHEYTQANLEFALAVEPCNTSTLNYRDRVQLLRAENKPTLPSSIGLELEINPFMRCHHDTLHKAASAFSQKAISSDVDTFATIRSWKDNF